MKKFAKDLERGDHITLDGRYQTIVSTRDSFLNVEPEELFDVSYNQTWGL